MKNLLEGSVAIALTVGFASWLPGHPLQTVLVVVPVTRRYGDRYFVTPEALEEFGRAAANAPKGRGRRSATSTASRTNAQRQHDVARAEAQCREAGI